jgi:hypothetical protein
MLPRFDVVAIIAAYNEADIIEQIVNDLIRQGVHVYFLDDGSTDGTVEAVEPHVGHGVLRIDRLADTDQPVGRDGFAWERILRRKAQLAADLDANWIIHHDADEFRESPWAGVPLRDAIRRVDARGYNAIDFASLDFWPVHDRFRPGDDVRDAFSFYSPRAPYDRVQIRCWKKTNVVVDLASSGGHDAQFPGRNVFPLRFILRHYPIRGQAHGERKVFRERRARFLDAERARGWHVQYDGLQEGASFIRDASTLTAYDPDEVRLALTLGHRGVEALENDLARARANAEALAQERDALRTQGTELQQQLEACAREGERRAQELQARAVELARAQVDRDARSADVVALGNVVEEVRRVLAIRERESDNWRQTAADRTRQLAGIHRSMSWRWTSPARAALRLLRGR